MENYKNNSDKAKRENTQAPAEKKVISGEIRENTSLKSKIKSTFLGGDISSVRDYIIDEVILPNVVDGLMNAVNGAISIWFHRDPVARRRGDGRVAYNAISSSKSTKTREREIATRNSTDISEICLESRADAINVINYLRDRIEDYNAATVADFYDAIGASSNFTDNDYGWTNLDAAYISQSRDGYSVILPKVKYLK